MPLHLLAVWEVFKGPIYEMVRAAWPQDNDECFPREDGWDYLWLDFKDRKFRLYVNYLKIKLQEQQ
jgi:hypothetical protein